METVAIQTVYEMLKQRGYDEFSEDKKYITCTKDNRNMLVFKIPVNKFGINEFKSIIFVLKSKETFYNNCIIIYVTSATPSAKKTVARCFERNVELFNIQDLQYNITKHSLVPKHIVLPEKESLPIKARYGNKLPIILKTDPIMRFYNCKKGEIIKIVRKNGFVTYRMVK